MEVQRTCETCSEAGKMGVKANRELAGVWVCVDCIVAINREEVSKSTIARKPVEIVAKGAISTDASAGNLIRRLEITMQRLMNGEVGPEEANAVCKVSSETVKALDLLWRITK